MPVKRSVTGIEPILRDGQFVKVWLECGHWILADRAKAKLGMMVKCSLCTKLEAE